MKAILIETGSYDSPRWHRLCGYLHAGTEDERTAAYGHLMRWYDRWASQPETDAGVWLRQSMKEIGAWTGATGKEVAWGRALLDAGYMGTIKELYPEEIAGAFVGYVALSSSGTAMIDESFSAIQRRANAERLVTFIMNRTKRAKFAALLNVDKRRLEVSGEIPIGWLDLNEAARRAQDAQETSAPASREMLSDDLDYGTQGPDAPAVDTTPGMALAARDERRPIVGFSPANHQTPGTPAAHTGTPKNPVMLATVREFKYSDPMRAMTAMDNSVAARALFTRALQKDRGRVCAVLAGLTETDRQWSLMKNPAGVFVANLRQQGLLER